MKQETYQPKVTKFKDSETDFLVQSSSKPDQYYHVYMKVECECPHFLYRGVICKHIKNIFEELSRRQTK